VQTPSYRTPDGKQAVAIFADLVASIERRDFAAVEYHRKALRSAGWVVWRNAKGVASSPSAPRQGGPLARRIEARSEVLSKADSATCGEGA
jgi:hypothetical protein